MTRAAFLGQAQAAAERGMVDACSIRRATGQSTDPSSGVVTPTYTAGYSGKCRVQAARAEAQQHDSGEDYLLLLRLEVQLPISVTGLEVGDEITITAAGNDPDLVGRVFLVHDLFHKTDPTARRVQVTERTGS
jgi:hypothetical protein